MARAVTIVGTPLGLICLIAIHWWTSPESLERRGGGPDAEQGPAQEIEVTTAGNRFHPDRLFLRAGQPVKFTVHGSDVAHTFTIKSRKNSPEVLFDLEVPAGQTAAGVFLPRRPGILYLYCKYHQAMGMEGLIRVR